jgi:hypothetical protein
MMLLSSPPAQTRLAKAALYYARAGLPVFPLQPQGKTPLVRRGLYAATTDKEQIARWWRRFPQANIGIPTGAPSGWIVLDVDPRHSGQMSLEKLQRAIEQHAADNGCASRNLLATRIQRTGSGGLHLVFGRRTDLDLPVRNTVDVAGYHGLDLRGEGGYIAVAPSRHASGGIYRWINVMTPIPFPDFLVDLLRGRQHTLVDARIPRAPLTRQRMISAHRADPAGWLDFVLERASVGCRHHWALFLACRLLQEAALSPAQAEVWLREYVRRVPQGNDLYPLEDALDCLTWAATHAI